MVLQLRGVVRGGYSGFVEGLFTKEGRGSGEGGGQSGGQYLVNYVK